MFKAASLAFAISFGHASAQGGCYPAYQSDGAYADYDVGDWVSATKSIDEPCTYGEDGLGCGQNNIRVVTKTFNFECISSDWCMNVGYAPNGLYPTLAWKQEDEPCSGNAEIPSVLAPPGWEGGGCPTPFSGSAEYGGGDVVSVCIAGQSWCTVFKCKNDLPAPGKFCDMKGYEPGSSLYWPVAWDEEGSCSGTIEPTSSPAFDPVNFLGGCPQEFSQNHGYTGGDRVTKGNLVFECKPWPYDGLCNVAGYEPLVDIATLDAWTYAWNYVGHCDVDMASLSATPAIFDTKNNLGVCDDTPEYSIGTEYGPGELVTVCNHEHVCLVYRCASDMPHPSRWCGLDGYQPGSGTAWIVAWTEEGYCTVTAAPTTKPSISPNPSAQPSESPSISSEPSFNPSANPSSQPSGAPTSSAFPSSTPSNLPSISASPSSQPSMKPSASDWPTAMPSESPSTSPRPSSQPSESPSTSTSPSGQPSMNPSLSHWPTSRPSSSPSSQPSETPSVSTSPTQYPTTTPTKSPSSSPTMSPTKNPTMSPTKSPSSSPTTSPSTSPTASPTRPVCSPSPSTKLYTTHGNGFFTDRRLGIYDQATGVGSDVGSFGPLPPFGNSVFSIACDASNTLYATMDVMFNGHSLLGIVDPISGAAFPIGAAPGLRLQSLAIAPGTGTFYSVDWNSGGLFTIDPQSGGAATYVGASRRFEDICFDSQGTLYGVNGLTMWTIDTTTGTASNSRTLVGRVSNSPIYSCMFDECDNLYMGDYAGRLFTVDLAAPQLVLSVVGSGDTTLNERMGGAFCS